MRKSSRTRGGRPHTTITYGNQIRNNGERLSRQFLPLFDFGRRYKISSNNFRKRRIKIKLLCQLIRPKGTHSCKSHQPTLDQNLQERVPSLPQKILPLKID